MKQYKTNMITKSQRAIAYLLLICQLLTSCGGKNTLLPRDPNAQVMTTVHEQQVIYSEDVELSDEDQQGMEGQATAFIDGIFDRKHELDDSLNGSAAQEENKKLRKEKEKLARILEDKNAEAEEQKERADAEAVARQAAEAEAKQVEAKTKADIAIQLLKNNVDMSIISISTNLSVEKIEELKLKLDSETETTSASHAT